MTARTKTISVVIHQQIYPLLRDLADEKADGSMSTLIMVLIYAELVKHGKLNHEQVKELLK